MSDIEVEAVEELQQIMSEMIALFQKEITEKNDALLEVERKLSHQQWVIKQANEYINQLEQQLT